MTPRTTALLPVHLFGHPADVPALRSVATRHGLAVIEDAAQAHGSARASVRVGATGTACFSFYGSKNMTTGEGGMVVTDDAAVAARARRLVDLGRQGDTYVEPGALNFRMAEIPAALGLVQLERLAESNQCRRENADKICAGLQGVIPPVVELEVEHAFHQLTVRVPEGRDRLLGALAAAGIEARVYYPSPCFAHDVFAQCRRDDAPATLAACEEVLSLPVHPGVGPSERDRIVAAVNQAC